MPGKGLTAILPGIERKAKRFLLAAVLRLFGPLPAKAKFTGPLHSIVILAQEKLGDAILLTPLLENLRAALPGAKIHLVCFSPIFPFFEHDPNIDVVYRVKQDYWGYFKTIRRQTFDLLFSTKDHSSFTFLFHSRFIRARYKVGIAHPLHAGFFHHLIEVDFHQHMITKNCSLLDYLNLEYREADCRPYLPQMAVSSEVEAFLREVPARPVGINLSAGEKAREWSLDKWIAFVRAIDAPVVVFAMPDRLVDKHALEAMFDHVAASPPTGTIFAAGEIIRRLRLLISPDTALLHVASCFATPVVGLYRAEVIHYERFAPYRTPHRIIVSATNFVEDIPVAEVVSAALALLAEAFDP